MTGAVIFDLDGTVLESEEAWEEAFSVVISQRGIKVPGALRQPNGWAHEPGIGLEPNWRRILGGGSDKQEEERELARVVTEEYKNITGGEVRVKPGIIAAIEKIKSLKWRTALATTTYWHVVQDELEELALQLAFDVTVTGDEILMLKPDPEIFLLTAQKLEMDPTECVVVEDSIGGVRAGVDAGMKVIGLESDYAPKKMMMSAGAYKTLDDSDGLRAVIEELAVESNQQV